MTSSNCHRRKSKIPRKRDYTSCLTYNSSNEDKETETSQSIDLNMDCFKLNLNENNLQNENENFQKEANRSFKLTHFPNSAVQLIHSVLPVPRFQQNYPNLQVLYDEIKITCTNIDQMIDKYMKVYASTILQNISSTNSSPLSPDFTPSLNGSGKESYPPTIKRKTFRGTSDEENEIDLSFTPTEINNEVILSKNYSDIRVGKDLFCMMLLKASNSATRLIRLLMKNFFSQKELEVSSLSGEGYYKQKLNPYIITAIKEFIKSRHPKLKNGSINLCMTDVCVQARRVYRSKDPKTKAITNN